ncbi:MAG: hypothetical protein NVSMB13_18080 [Mycobacteriales bacterium]
MLVDGLPCTPIDRAVIDACRRLADLRSVRALMAESIQRGRVTVDLLRRELDAGPTSGSRLPRLALAEVDLGVRSAPEAELMALVRGSRLPMPR